MRRCGRVGTQRPVAGLQLGSLNLGDASMQLLSRAAVFSPQSVLTSAQRRILAEYLNGCGAAVMCMQKLNVITDEFETIVRTAGHGWEAVCSHDHSLEQITGGNLAGLAVFSRYPITQAFVVQASGMEDAKRKISPVKNVNSKSSNSAQPNVRCMGFPGFPPPRKFTPAPEPEPTDKTQRAALVCQIAVPLEAGVDELIWVANLALDEQSEESRLLQVNTLLNRITQLEPSFAPAHVLCGAFNSLYHDDYSDGAWDLIAKAFALRSSEALDGPALQTAIVEARHGRDLVMDHLLQQYRDSRAEAGLNGVFVDGARVEGTTDEDTREDYILLSPSLKWSVDLKGYDLKVKPRGLTSCHHMVSVHLLPPPSNNNELENARRLPAQAPISDLSRREFQKGDGGRTVVFPGVTKEVSQASLSSSLSDLNHKLTTARRDSSEEVIDSGQRLQDREQAPSSSPSKASMLYQLSFNSVVSELDTSFGTAIPSRTGKPASIDKARHAQDVRELHAPAAPWWRAKHGF